VGGKIEQKVEKMCGITVNSKESGGNDSKVNDLKLQDSTRATLVSELSEWGGGKMFMAQQYA
jgi:hypothetical protein